VRFKVHVRELMLKQRTVTSHTSFTIHTLVLCITASWSLCVVFTIFTHFTSIIWTHIARLFFLKNICLWRK